MSTTYWAVKRYPGEREPDNWTGWLGEMKPFDGQRVCWWADDPSRCHRGKFSHITAERRAKAARKDWPGFRIVLVKVTRYDKAESRQRAEARGAVAALEQVLAKWMGLDKRTEGEVRGLLADARKRAGL